MSLLKLKLNEQGLVALLLFVFTSCDKLLPTSGSGVDIPVKIRAVSIAGGAQNETVTRAGGASRIVGEPVSLSFGEGLSAEITVEEDVSALRDDPTPQPLETDKTFRVIALKHSDQTYLSHADFKVGGSSDYSSPDLHVPEGLECDFICISFNDKDAMPAMTASDIGALALNASKDFLYQRIKTSINGNSAALSFTELEHQFTKVTLIIDAGSGTITSVSNSIKINSVVSPATFNLKVTTNALTGTTSGDVSFTSWESTSATIWQDALRLLPTSSGTTLSLPEGAIIVGSLKSKATDVPLPVLGVGKSYTVRLELAPESEVGYFAGELTEDAYGVWQFTKKLYVRNKDMKDAAGSTTFRWETTSGNKQNGTYDADGKTSTFNLATSTSYTNPAAELCFQKNTGYANITGVSDANYKWYLPAKKQLMAIWAVHNSFVDAAKFSSASYHSSTEYSATALWIVNFSEGRTEEGSKAGSFRARCVREV